MSNAHVWRAAQERLRQEMTKAQFDTWLRGTWLDEERDGVMTLCVRTTFAKELLETRYRERIEAAIASVIGRACTIKLAVVTGESAPATSVADTPSPQAQPRRQSQVRHQDGPTLFDNLLANEPAPIVPTPVTATSRPLANNLRRQPALPAVREREFSRRVGVGASHLRKRETPPYKGIASRNERDGGNGGFDEAADYSAVEVDESQQAVRLQGARSQRGGVGSMNEQVNGNDDDQRTSAADVSSAANNAGSFANEEAAQARELASTQIAAPRLNQRYTFSTFIVGSGNQLAHAASQAVADTPPGRAYNPLFLYGGVGLGKTHLLHAIGHTALAKNLLVLYVSSETFTNEIVNAIRYRTTEEFRAKYRSVDVLLVDDIQFIAGKDSTEEEFFHTFNTLYEASKQIVICSDRPPKAIVSLEERLRSRFEWGLIADIQPPDLETRVAILRAKSDVMGRHVPDEVIDYLASRVQSNIRELEGSFNRLLALTQLQGLPLTLETAKAALNNLANDGHQKRVNVDEILDAVAEYYRVSRDVLCGKQRDKHIVVPRQVAMFLMRQETQASLLEIGQALGGRDHSTVLHGCEKIGREVNDNTTLRKEVMAIRQQLLS